MAHPRVHRLFEVRTQTQGDAIFGETRLIPPDDHTPRTPIRRVAVCAEAFLPKIDGVSRTAYLAVRYLQMTGREVLIFAPDIAVPQVEDSEVVGLPSVSMPRAEESRAALPVPAMLRRLQAFQPEMILLFSPAVMSAAAIYWAGRNHIPVIGIYQTDLPGYTKHYGFPLLARPVRAWLRYWHNHCHLTLCPTKKVRDELAQEGYARLRLWGRGVNIDLFHPQKRSAAMRERLLQGRDSAALLCIYVGRLAKEKCVHLLREMAALPNVALTIIGDGAEREELERLFAGTGTVFTGYLIGEELAEAFASADAFFFPGAQETFGQVVQEAMASGLPCVVTERGGVAGLVEQGVTGYICEHTATAFTRAALQLRDQPMQRQMMAHTARRLAEQRPWSAIMAQLERYMRIAYRLNHLFV